MAVGRGAADAVHGEDEDIASGGDAGGSETAGPVVVNGMAPPRAPTGPTAAVSFAITFSVLSHLFMTDG